MKKRYPIEKRDPKRHEFNELSPDVLKNLRQEYDCRNIKRIQGKFNYNSGWQVCFKREGQWHTKLFADKASQSFERALKEAIVWRDKMLLALGSPLPRWPQDHVKYERVEAMHFSYNNSCSKLSKHTTDRLKVSCMTCLSRISEMLKQGLDPDDQSNW